MNGLTPYLLMAAAMHGMTGMGMPRRSRNTELDGIDIEKEYELIQQKKSGLSRRLRERVCYIYEHRER